VIEYRRRFHRRDAVLPNLPGFAAHHAERTRFGGERETLPFVAVGTAKPIPRMGPAPSLQSLTERRRNIYPDKGIFGI
jgi:hypothetical protein